MSSDVGIRHTEIDARRALGLLALVAGTSAVVAAVAAGFSPQVVGILMLGASIVAGIRFWPLLTLGGVAVFRGSVERLASEPLVDLGGTPLALPDAITIFVLIGTLWVLVHRIREGTHLWKLPLAVPMLAFLSVATISLVYSPGLLVGLKEVVKLSASFLPFLVVMSSDASEYKLRFILGGIVIGSVVPIVVGWTQFFGAEGIVDPNAGLRVSSVFDHPNTFGLYLVIVLVACWGLRSRATPAVRTALTVLMVAALGALPLTLARSAWLAAGMVVLTIGMRKRRLLVGLAAVGGALVLLVPRLQDRVLDVFGAGTAVSGAAASNSLDIRLEIWRLAFPLFKRSPIIGQGWAAFEQFTTGIFAHNDYLRIVAELGMVGLFVFGIFIVRLLIAAYRAARCRDDLPRAFFGLAIGFVLISAFTNNLDKAVFQWYFWVLAGVSLMWTSVVRDEPADDRGKAEAT